MGLPSAATIVNGVVLGWSVAWPPGPINAEMIRRAVLPPKEGGGFWAAWQLGLGACKGPRIFARPARQIGTQLGSSLVMLVFAARLVWLGH